MKKRARIGDVVEAKAPGGFAYLHYIGKHPEYAEGVLVCPKIYAKRPSLNSGLFVDAYFRFYPVGAAISWGLVKVVGNLPAPDFPSRLRRGAGHRGIKVVSWIIKEGNKEVLKKKLSMEELKIPIVEFPSHDLLIEDIAEGWRPEHEGGTESEKGGEESEEVEVTSSSQQPVGDSEALNELMKVSKRDSRHSFRHFLYFAQEVAADKAAEILRKKGFQTEKRRDTEDASWLVIACNQVLPSEKLLTGIRNCLEKLADRLGGEYDGWESDTVT